MVKALLDTNVLIDYLNGLDAAAEELGRYANKAISIITWMEVMTGTTPEEEAAVRAWLLSFEVLAMDEATAERAVAIRKARRIRLPDAVIWATAQVHGRLLVSRNTKDFPETEPGVRLPYGAVA